jgi:hypothetical protein
MDQPRNPVGGYTLAALLGAAAGGTTVAIITKAIPNMMSRMISSMMGDVMKQMGGQDCNPEEM